MILSNSSRLYFESSFKGNGATCISYICFDKTLRIIFLDIRYMNLPIAITGIDMRKGTEHETNTILSRDFRRKFEIIDEDAEIFSEEEKQALDMRDPQVYVISSKGEKFYVYARAVLVSTNKLMNSKNPWHAIYYQTEEDSAYYASLTRF